MTSNSLEYRLTDITMTIAYTRKTEPENLEKITTLLAERKKLLRELRVTEI